MKTFWGYFCKTCETSSARWFDDPRMLRQLFVSANETLEQIWSGESARPGTRELQPLLFLSRHYGHEVWAETETARLALPGRGRLGGSVSGE